MNIHDIKALLHSNGIYNGIVVGSQAITVLDDRTKADLDVVVMPKDIPYRFRDKISKDSIIPFNDGEQRIELLVAYDNTLAELYNAYYRAPISLADTTMLYIIKRGHIHQRMRKWDKHMSDLVQLNRVRGLTDDEQYGTSAYTVSELIRTQRIDTDLRLGAQKLPKLNVTKEHFFDDGVKKYIEHDYLHEVFAHNDKPMYNKMQKNGEVLCYKHLWNKFTQLEKVQTVLEECYVIASERCIIPKLVNDSKEYYARSSFMWALMRVCTDLASGFFRAFAIDNYSDIIDAFDPFYYRKILSLEFSL